MFTDSQITPPLPNSVTLPIKPEELSAVAMYQALLPNESNHYIQPTEAVQLRLARNVLDGLQTLSQAFPGVYDSKIATERLALIEHLRANRVDTAELEQQSTEDISQLVTPLGTVRPWEFPSSTDSSIAGEIPTDLIEHHPMEEVSIHSIPTSGGSVSIKVPSGSTTVSLESNSTSYTTEYDPTVTITGGSAILRNPQSLSIIEITIRDDQQNVLYSGTIGGRELQDIEIPGLRVNSDVQVEMRYRP